MRGIWLRSWRMVLGLSAGFLLLAGPASADWEWLSIHGHSGQIQNPSGVSGGPTEGGLKFTLKDLSTSVHFAVPSRSQSYTTSTATAAQWKVRYLRLKFWTGSSDACITKIHVWDGDLLLKEINYSSDKSWYGLQDLTIDLGKKWRILRALGVSVEVSRGVESMNHDFAFYSVGARWEK